MLGSRSDEKQRQLFSHMTAVSRSIEPLEFSAQRRFASAWRGFLSLRDLAGALHAAGPPEFCNRAEWRPVGRMRGLLWVILLTWAAPG
jgi:hypothetical protein